MTDNTTDNPIEESGQTKRVEAQIDNLKVTELLSIFDGLPAFDTLREQIETRGDLLPLGLTRNGYLPTLAKIAQEQPAQPILLITGKVENVPILLHELRTWLHENRIIQRFPEPTPLPYDRAPWGENSRHGRLTTLTQLMAGQHPLIPATDNPPIIVTSARALLQQTLPKRNFLKNTRVLKLGQIIDLPKIEKMWVGLGYERANVVERMGQFSQRGGILDIFPASGTIYPIRIELFGDEIDTLRWFDPTTQRSVPDTAAPQRVLISPAREAIPADGVELGQTLQYDAPPKEDDLPAWQDDIETLAKGELSSHAEFYLPLIYQRPESLLHYLPNGSLVFVDDWVALKQAVTELHEQAEKQEGEQHSLPTGYPNPLFLWQEIAPLLAKHRTIVLGEHIPSAEKTSNVPLTEIADAFQAGPRYGGQMRPLMFQLQYAKRTGEPTIIVSRQAQRLAEMWRYEQSNERDTAEEGNLFALAPAVPEVENIHFVTDTLSEGFTLQRVEPDGVVLNLLTDAEIFGWNRPAPRRAARQRTFAPETYFSDLQMGNFVVHTEHGIGQFLGLVVRSIAGSDREYLKLEYANNDILYVPVHHADRMSKWIGSEDFAPKLNRLGNARWSEAKKKAQKQIDELADELLELYASREEIAGHAFTMDSDWQVQLEASFPYQETEDQLAAIDEVKKDMESPRPMDRLVCGDVGYGKTEVALRAAFKAVTDGKQVAILVPTTVLAQQHHKTFVERLHNFPVKIELLSRFRTQSQQKVVIGQLKEGKVDIVIGTHRLMSNDVSFKDLGLLIIDEEQRFGVAHKERLKRLRTEVDVLTMTATPIPRTMHMALSGLRDISLIATAPAERLPVQSYVGEIDNQLVRRAILRELDRGGQVYFVHNRVQTIESIRETLQKIVPEAIIAVGHGQMGERELETVMENFSNGNIDILLSTTIIESGLDIPNANTMIVNRADQFGLSQLYQLRGRVGRGAHRAYAYFFHAAWRTLNAEAKARLETIAETTELGSGYTIAMRDLEIRGAGDLLGANQSGHIASIGFDLYTRMLARAIKIRKQAKAGELIEMELPDTVLVDLPLATYIPEDYVPDAALRLRLYRRMAVLGTLEAIDGIASELADRFGPIPDPVENLLYQLRVKIMAIAGNVASVTTEPKQIKIYLHNFHSANRTKLQITVGRAIPVSRTGIWVDRLRPTREWQIALVQVLEKMELFAKGGRPK